MLDTQVLKPYLLLMNALHMINALHQYQAGFDADVISKLHAVLRAQSTPIGGTTVAEGRTFKVRS